MSTRVLRFALAALSTGVLLSSCSLGGSRSTILLDRDSTSGASQTTSAFAVSGPWQIRYTFDCTKQNSEGVLNSDQFTVDVFNGDDNSTAYEHPQTTVVSVKRKGVLAFSTPGNYYLHVDTACDWTLQVVDATGGAPAQTPAPRVAPQHGSVTVDVTFSAVFGPYACDLTGTPGALCEVADGTADRSPFGPLTLHRTVGDKGGTGACHSAGGAGTLTAANGDTLQVTADGGQVCPQIGHESLDVTVTGGTGVFGGATGKLTVVRQGDADHWAGAITLPS